MSTPQLYRQLQTQLSQWITPKDKGQGFGGIEPHFKDYKSAAFELPRSKLRDTDALSRLLMLLAAATIIASFLHH